MNSSHTKLLRFKRQEASLLLSMIQIGLIALTLIGCSREDRTSPEGVSGTISDIAGHFTNYNRITKQPVEVNPEFAMLCRGLSQEDVAATRKKSGPHAFATVTIFMNDSAARAFGGGSPIYPVGAVIIKQKVMSHGVDKKGQFVVEHDNGVGGMLKRPAGYDPEHGDWEYFYFENPAKIESGRISTCVQCHDGAKDKDYVFGTWHDRK